MQSSAMDAKASNIFVTHLLDPEDAPVTAAIRSMTSAAKGAPRDGATRGRFDAVMEAVSPRQDVTTEEATVGGIPGIWVRPANSRQGEAILHLHGGWFNFGSASAYRHLIGQIAARAGSMAFVPDYRLAPEHPFPAATDDVVSCYKELAQSGIRRIAITGDSAGGNLALGLTARVAASARTDGAILVGVAVLSPVTDLTLSGASYETRAEADPLFTRRQVADLVRSYLGGVDGKDPLASPLYGQLAGLPPVRIQVGDDELLLDDSLRYAQRAFASGVDARVDVWMGMPHGFQAQIGRLKAATSALDAIGAFLDERLRGHEGS